MTTLPRPLTSVDGGLDSYAVPGDSVARIEIRNLEIRFGQLEVMAGMNLSIGSGEFVSLLGPSGCGKSTLLRIIAGLLKPASGLVHVGYKAPDKNDSGSTLGMMFQKPLLLPWRTALENVLLPVELSFGGSAVRPMDMSRARHLLEMVQLQDFADKYPHELSGGMQQRVALARTLMPDPELLLLDEPFGALDELTRETLNEELLAIWRSAETRLSTVIMVTHSIQEAVAMSDRIFIFSAKPAQIREEVKVDIPHPRSPDSSEFIHLLAHIRQLFKVRTA